MKAVPATRAAAGGRQTSVATRVTLLAAALAVMLPVAVGGLTLPGNPLQGRLLFESKRCYQCHGIAGSGSGVAPSLGEGRFRGSFLDLGAALWNHVPGMSVRFEGTEIAWPQLSPNEVVEITSFLYYLDYLGRPGDPREGSTVFKSKGCAGCHRIGGKGGPRAGPDLAELKRFASPLFVAEAIWDHGPRMLDEMQSSKIPPPTFKEGDLADLSAFIRQAAQAGPQERILIEPGDPNEGRAVFETRGCITCHSVRGTGGTGGPDLSLTDLHRPAEAIAGTMWNHAFAMYASIRQRGVGWPRLTTPELADLIAFLYFLPFSDPPGDAKRGAQVFADRSCAECHAPSDRTAKGAPGLAGSPATASPEALVAAMWNHAPVMQETILAAGRPWPELTGSELRDLLAFLTVRSPRR